MHELPLGFLLVVATPAILLAVGLIVLATAGSRSFYAGWFRRSALTLLFVASVTSGFGAAAFVAPSLWLPIVGLAAATSLRSVLVWRSTDASLAAVPLPALIWWLFSVWSLALAPGLFVQAMMWRVLR